VKSLYHAYEAYERKLIQGALNAPRSKSSGIRKGVYAELVIRFGDFLIQAGIRLKRHYTAGKPMAWSPMTGNKP
jgi:hypothetical protein